MTRGATPEHIARADAILRAREQIDQRIAQLGTVRVAECIEMALPQILAIIALAEGTLPHDDKLTSLLGALHNGQQQVARYLVEHTPQRIVAVADGVRA